MFQNKSVCDSAGTATAKINPTRDIFYYYESPLNRLRAFTGNAGTHTNRWRSTPAPKVFHHSLRLLQRTAGKTVLAHGSAWQSVAIPAVVYGLPWESLRAPVGTVGTNFNPPQKHAIPTMFLAFPMGSRRTPVGTAGAHRNPEGIHVYIVPTVFGSNPHTLPWEQQEPTEANPRNSREPCTTPTVFCGIPRECPRTSAGTTGTHKTRGERGSSHGNSRCLMFFPRQPAVSHGNLPLWKESSQESEVTRGKPGFIIYFPRERPAQEQIITRTRSDQREPAV